MKLAYKIFFLVLSIVIVAILLTNIIFSLNAKNAVIEGVVNEAKRIATEAASEINNDALRIQEYELLQANPK